jgi:hypothetical protein
MNIKNTAFAPFDRQPKQIIGGGIEGHIGLSNRSEDMLADSIKPLHLNDQKDSASAERNN